MQSSSSKVKKRSLDVVFGGVIATGTATIVQRNTHQPFRSNSSSFYSPTLPIVSNQSCCQRRSLAPRASSCSILSENTPPISMDGVLSTNLYLAVLHVTSNLNAKKIYLKYARRLETKVWPGLRETKEICCIKGGRFYDQERDHRHFFKSLQKSFKFLYQTF